LLFVESSRALFLLDDFEGADGSEDVAGLGFLAGGDNGGGKWLPGSGWRRFGSVGGFAGWWL
jgi:hypothetical protein